MRITPTLIPTHKRLDEIFERYQEPFNKLRADRWRETAAENVWLRRFDLGLNNDEKKHRESIKGQSTEGNHDVQQGSSREDT